MVYIYDSYNVPSSEWRELLAPDGKITIRNTPLDVIAIGLYVEKGDNSKLSSGYFDGFYTYFAAQNFVYGSTSRNWREMKNAAKQNPRLRFFIPSVGPGYDDTVVRPWNFRNTKDRLGGNYYRQMWADALQLQPEIVSITSFNEWHEGTQIEKAVQKEGYSDYGSDPEFYLKLTREVSDWLGILLMGRSLKIARNSCIISLFEPNTEAKRKNVTPLFPSPEAPLSSRQ